MVVLCDECDAAWPTEEIAGRPTYATEVDMPCPCCQASLLKGGSRWATREEAAAVGLSDDRLVDNGATREPIAGDE